MLDEAKIIAAAVGAAASIAVGVAGALAWERGPLGLEPKRAAAVRERDAALKDVGKWQGIAAGHDQARKTCEDRRKGEAGQASGDLAAVTEQAGKSRETAWQAAFLTGRASCKREISNDQASNGSGDGDRGAQPISVRRDLRSFLAADRWTRAPAGSGALPAGGDR